MSKTEEAQESLIESQRNFIEKQDRKIEFLEAENKQLLELVPADKRPLTPTQTLALEAIRSIIPNDTRS